MRINNSSLEKNKGLINNKISQIPLDWDINKLKDICKVRQGLQIAIKDRLRKKIENSFVYITNKYLANRNAQENIFYIKSPPPNVICKKDDILMTRTGNTGIVVTGVEGVFHNNFFLVDYNRDLVNKLYLKYYLESQPIQNMILNRAGTTTIPDLNHRDFYTIPFIKPPLLEQEKIASILSAVDDAITKTQTVIDKTEHLQKGLMQQLLTKGIGHTEFKTTKLGEIPKEWEVKKIEDISIIKSGFGFKFSEYVSDGIKILKIFNVFAGKINWDNLSFLPISYKITYSEFMLKEGDIVIALNRPITRNKVKVSKILKVDLPCILYQRVGRFDLKDNVISPDYFFHYLRSNKFKSTILKILVGSDQPYIKTTELIKKSIPIPSLYEQEKITQILSSMEETIYYEYKNKRKLEILKKGLMQKLLTGKLRVTT